MIQPADVREWRLLARTDLWTGDVERKGDRAIPTGLLGSIRWWCEVLVRGLGGAVCDPTESNNRCPEGDRRCPVCELFGSTSWARKFRFEVRDAEDKVLSQNISKGKDFVLRFTPLRYVRPQEWALLDLTLRLIGEHGAMGGKTVLKPSDEEHRATLPHHRDYGLVKVEDCAVIEPVPRNQLVSYIRSESWRKPPQDELIWASLSNFWCVNGRYLPRSTFNRVLGRGEHNDTAQQVGPRDRAVSSWLAGGQGTSKKVFSFKDPRRTFGFVDPPRITFGTIKERLKEVWETLGSEEFMTGDSILAALFAEGASSA